MTSRVSVDGAPSHVLCHPDSGGLHGPMSPEFGELVQGEDPESSCQRHVARHDEWGIDGFLGL